MFDYSRITSERSRAGLIISSLDYEVVQTIGDLITADPPKPNLYTEVKNRIIANFSASPESELRTILKGEVFTEGKPSLMLSKIRHLSRGRCSKDVIRAIFLEQSPANCRSILSLSDLTDVSRLSLVADKVIEQINVGDHSIAAVSVDNELMKRVDALASKVDPLSTQANQRSRSLSRNKTNSRSELNHSRNRSVDRRNNGRCYYHARFGRNAKFCNAPCSWNQSGNGNCYCHERFGSEAKKCRSPCSVAEQTSSGN